MVSLDADVLSRAASEAFEFLRRDYRRLFVNLLKVEVISLIIMAMTLVFIWSAAFITLQNVAAFYSSLAMAAITVGVIAAIGLAGGFFAAVANSIGYNVVDSAYSKTHMRYVRTFRGNMFPMLKYLLMSILINSVAFLPFLALFIGIAYLTYEQLGTTASVLLINMAELILRVVLAVLGAILYLFLQFAIFELLIGRRGVVESFRESIGIMRGYPLETMIFSFALWAVITGISIPFMIVFLLLFVLAAGAGIGISSIAGALAFWPLLIVGGLFFLGLLLVFSVITNAVLYAAQYVYWKQVRRLMAGPMHEGEPGYGSHTL